VHSALLTGLHRGAAQPSSIQRGAPIPNPAVSASEECIVTNCRSWPRLLYGTSTPTMLLAAGACAGPGRLAGAAASAGPAAGPGTGAPAIQRERAGAAAGAPRSAAALFPSAAWLMSSSVQACSARAHAYLCMTQACFYSTVYVLFRNAFKGRCKQEGALLHELENGLHLSKCNGVCTRHSIMRSAARSKRHNSEFSTSCWTTRYTEPDRQVHVQLRFAS